MLRVPQTVTHPARIVLGCRSRRDVGPSAPGLSKNLRLPGADALSSRTGVPHAPGIRRLLRRCPHRASRRWFGAAGHGCPSRPTTGSTCSGPLRVSGPGRLRERTDTVVIGGGQAGLVMSSLLTQHRREHVVLEPTGPAHAWGLRWDTFTLNALSGRALNLPGLPYPGADPDGYAPVTRSSPTSRLTSRNCVHPYASGCARRRYGQTATTTSWSRPMLPCCTLTTW
jgi:hypothetical protein